MRDSRLNLVRNHVDTDNTDGHQPHADDEPGTTTGGSVEHCQHSAEEHQRRTKVILQSHDDSSDAPDQQNRAQIANTREINAQETLTRHIEQRALIHQQLCEEDQQHDLGKLTRLHGKRADGNPDAGISINRRRPHQR